MRVGLPDCGLLPARLQLGPQALGGELPEQFVQTFTEGLLTYATGRTLDYSDMPAVRRIVRNSAASGYRFSTIVQAIVRRALASRSPSSTYIP